MTAQAPDRIWSGIDIVKTLAGALAAVCAAWIGSFLGVAGTVAGATADGRPVGGCCSRWPWWWVSLPSCRS